MRGLVKSEERLSRRHYLGQEVSTALISSANKRYSLFEKFDRRRGKYVI